MGRYDRAVRHLRGQAGLLLGCCAFALAFGLASAWGAADFALGSSGGGASDFVAAAALLGIAAILLPLSRRFYKKARRIRSIMDQLRKGHVSSARFRVTEKLSATRGENTGSVEIVRVVDLAAGRPREFHADRDIWDRIRVGGVYQIEYIDGYSYVLSAAEVI